MVKYFFRRLMRTLFLIKRHEILAQQPAVFKGNSYRDDMLCSCRAEAETVPLEVHNRVCGMALFHDNHKYVIVTLLPLYSLFSRLLSICAVQERGIECVWPSFLP